MRRPYRTRVLLERSVVAGAVLLLLGAAGLYTAFTTIDQWFLVVFNPGAFDSAATPPAPDYSAPAAWAALPTTEDGADVSLPELPAIDQGAAPVDVFYVHPTTSLGAVWNAPFDDPAIIEATTRGGTLIQASVFNGCCAVYAPRYRQANGRAFTHLSPEGDKAIDVAYADVSAAFDQYTKQNPDRPLILASHSQGTVLAARLLRERATEPVFADRLVVAYLIGGPIAAEDVAPTPICENATQNGCVVGWNARTPHYEPNAFEFYAHRTDPMDGRICVNPLTWSAALSGEPVAAARQAHLGALFFDAPAGPRLLPGFADATCTGGALVVSEIGQLDRDFMSGLLLKAMPGNYHAIEYQLFYANLRQNAKDRVAAFSSKQATAVTPATIPTPAVPSRADP